MTWSWSRIRSWVVIASQLLFIAGDLLARLKMRPYGLNAGAFASWWFAAYIVVRTPAMFGQLWVLSKLVLGQTLPLFAAASKTVVGGGLAVAALVELTLPS
jgi:hypothetical protein